MLTAVLPNWYCFIWSVPFHESWHAGTTPQSGKASPRIQERIRMPHVGSHQVRESIREFCFRIDQVMRCHLRSGFRIPSISFWVPRAAPTMPRNSAQKSKNAFALPLLWLVTLLTFGPAYLKKNQRVLLCVGSTGFQEAAVQHHSSESRCVSVNTTLFQVEWIYHQILPITYKNPGNN